MAAFSQRLVPEKKFNAIGWFKLVYRFETCLKVRHFSTFFSRRFRRKCTTLTVASFFSSVHRDRSPFLFIWFICSTSSTLTTDVQNILEMPEPRLKQNHRRPEPRKHRTPFGVFHSDFFRHYATFFEFFGFHQRVSPSFVSIFYNTMDNGCQKSQRVPPFTFFGTVTLFKNLIIKIFRKIPRIPFFHILQPTVVSQSPKGPPFYNF